MTVSTDRAEELRLLDVEIEDLQTQLRDKLAEAMKLYVSLLVDEMLKKAEELGGNINDAVEYYFGDMRAVLMFDKTTYLGQIFYRVPNGRNSIEPFASCFNEEIKRRGATVGLHSIYGGWYGTGVGRV